MKVLVVTNLFPNCKEPTRGQYNRQQLKELSRHCNLKIIAPIPLFKYSLEEVPGEEVIEGLNVWHPRYLVIPKVLRSLYGFLFFIGILKIAKRLHKEFNFDLIFCLWVYPDGFGSYLLSKYLNKPIVIGVLGTDVNLYTKYFFRRNMIIYALKNCRKVIAVSNSLKEKLVNIGIPQNRISVILNGVDSDLFSPRDKTICRRKLGLPEKRKIILFIGNLTMVKGLNYLIDAFHRLSFENKESDLFIVGRGELRKSLGIKVNSLGLFSRVKFIGAVEHSEISTWINACDIFCLPSLDEGCPNVVLEALACEKIVIASKVGGIPELIKSEKEGILVPPKNSQLLAESILKILNCNKTNEILENNSKKRTWSDVAFDEFNEFREIVSVDSK